MIRVLGGAIIALVSLASSGLAQQAEAGGDDERARGHFLAARSYYEQGRYEDAAEQFLESYRLSERHELLLNAATAYERALRFEDSASMLEQYLEAVPDSGDRHSIEERITRMRAMANRSREEREASAGTVSRDVAGPPPASSSDDGIGGLGITGIVLLGVGVGAGVATIATGATALDLHASLESRCDVDGACPAGSSGDIEQGEAMAVASTALLPVTVVALGVGAALLAVDLTDGSGDERVSLIGGPGDIGLGVRGAF